MKNYIYSYGGLSVLLLISVLHSFAQTGQPVIAYLTIDGHKQGVFKGGAALQGRQSQIECVGFSYSVQTPTDPSSGGAVGKRQQNPIVIVKRLDQATPQILQAIYTNEELKSVEIELVNGAAEGGTATIQKIKLTNAIISRDYQYGGVSSPDKLLPNGVVLEEVSFTFQKIEVENVNGKTSASDDWSRR